MGKPLYAESSPPEAEDLLPRWMKSVIAHQAETAVRLPFQRAAKKNEGLLPPPRPTFAFVMSRISDR